MNLAKDALIDSSEDDSNAGRDAQVVHVCWVYDVAPLVRDLPGKFPTSSSEEALLERHRC